MIRLPTFLLLRGGPRRRASSSCCWDYAPGVKARGFRIRVAEGMIADGA